MPPRLQILRSVRVQPARSAWGKQSHLPASLAILSAPIRHKTTDEKPLPGSEKSATGPGQKQSLHISEEAAATNKIMGKDGPDLEQGTPVEEVLQRDPSAKEKAPKVLKDTMKSSIPDGKRSYSTSSRRQQEAMISAEPVNVERIGHKYDLPELPLPRTSHIKHRYDPIVKQVTQLMMERGKLATAQRGMAKILNILRTSPAPTFSIHKPLLPGAPPAAHLPLNPILYLTLAIDSVAPLLRIRQIKGAAGGGAALPLPQPMALKQRRRTAIMWILGAADKKKFRGSGKDSFAQKVAEELIAVVEGRSGVWERRNAIHKLGVNARANLTKMMAFRRR